MKEEQKEFIEIMTAFRKLNISSMLPDLISHGEFSLLKMIESSAQETENGRWVKVSHLVKKLCVPAPAISRTLRSLEDKNFIERTADKSDRRNTFVSLTEEGKAMNREIDGIMEGFADAVFGNMGEETMQKLNGYLRAFLETSRKEIDKRKYTGKKGERR